MNTLRKIILSLLISALIFAVFSAAAFTGLFDLVELRLYNPQILRGLNREIAGDAGVIGGLLDELWGHFSSALEGDAVKRSFLPDQAAEDIFERSRTFGGLLNSLPGLRSVRFVDAGGSRIHFSTLEEDILHQDGSSLTYRSYRDCPGVLPYNDVETPENGAPRLVFDSQGEQLIFSFPFSDTQAVYRGSALFTLSVRALAERMIREGRIKVGEDVSVVSRPGGFLLGLPRAGKESLKGQTAAAWEEGILNLSGLDEESLEPLVLVSAKYTGTAGRDNETVFVGRLVQESLFAFPPLMEFILLGSFFLTVFLLVFLLFNLRQDSVTVISSRLKLLQSGLFQQYYEQKGLMDWKHWARELEQRRGEVRAEIKRDLPRGSKKPPVQAKIDALIDLSWDEVVATIGSRPAVELDEGKLRAIVADVLQHSGGLLPDGAAGPAAGGNAVPAEEIEELGEPENPAEAEPELLEELGAEESPSGDWKPAGPVETEDAEVLEELEELEEPEKTKSSGEILVTPEAFESIPEAELEPLEEAAPPLSGSPGDLDALASQIEFGPPGGEESAGEEESPDIASPFDSLSFESPSFPGNDETAGEAVPNPGERKKKVEADADDTGLTEITGEGGLPFIYQPFLFRGNGKPLFLRPLEDNEGESIRERNGIHVINSDILDPNLESSDHLDPKFLQLVQSIIVKKD
jgi:hypothetical protein